MSVDETENSVKKQLHHFDKFSICFIGPFNTKVGGIAVQSEILTQQSLTYQYTLVSGSNNISMLHPYLDTIDNMCSEVDTIYSLESEALYLFLVKFLVIVQVLYLPLIILL